MEASVRRLFQRYERFFDKSQKGDMEMEEVASLCFLSAKSPTEKACRRFHVRSQIMENAFIRMPAGCCRNFCAAFLGTVVDLAGNVFGIRRAGYLNQGHSRKMLKAAV